MLVQVYFLADILHSLAMLSKVFKFINVTNVGSNVRIEVALIRMIFIVESCDLNIDIFLNLSVIMVCPITVLTLGT